MSVSDKRISYMFNNTYSQSDLTIDSNINPIASLLTVNTVGGINSVNTISAQFELIVEHGYSITKNSLVVSSSTNIFNIVEGFSNFLGSGDIPDGVFNGWFLLNRKNMKYATIDSNINKALYISNLDTSIIEDNDNDFVVIPNATEIEYEVSVSSNVDKPSIPFYFKKSIWNINSRLKIYAYMPSVSTSFLDSVSVTVKYRMLDDSGKQYPFSNLAIAQFTNIKGNMETLSNSSFSINLADIEPQEKQRNYS